MAKDWLRVRKDKQQRTLTKTAWATVKAESVKAGMALDESLREAVARGWAGFKASWLDKASPPGRQPQPSKHTGFDSKDYSAGADEHGIIV